MKRRTLTRTLLGNIALMVLPEMLLIGGWRGGSALRALADDSKSLPQTHEVEVTVTPDKQSYRRGEIVSFTITARNTGKTTQKLTFMSGQRFDLTATREGENEPAWRWSEDKVFTLDIRTVSILPGRVKTWTAVWEQTDRNGNVVPRGGYTIDGELTPHPRIAASPVVVELEG